ncbi:glycine--tRNA ligase subunit beta, partial [Micrococcus luteus]|nr:glycine--tRNA ligase subunit beta [Micrococcus luteus]
FMGAKTISLTHADEYEQRFADEGMVIADFERRQAMIREQLHRIADSLDTTLGEDPEVAELLNEVTALVEHPTVYVGQFDRKFLAVPQACLILTMRLNQKYFPLFNKGIAWPDFTGIMRDRDDIALRMHSKAYATWLIATLGANRGACPFGKEHG